MGSWDFHVISVIDSHDEICRDLQTL